MKSRTIGSLSGLDCCKLAVPGWIYVGSLSAMKKTCQRKANSIRSGHARFPGTPTSSSALLMQMPTRTSAFPEKTRTPTDHRKYERQYSRRNNFYSLPPRNLRSGDIAFLCINGRKYIMAAVISLKNLTDGHR